MVNFIYSTPTKIIFGKDGENQVGELIKGIGAKKVLVHYGGGSVIASGLLDRVKKSLDASNISYTEQGGVVPNPRLTKVREGIKIAQEENVDFILAVGGGSVIDSAKAIGTGALYDGDVWDFFSGKSVPSKTIPVGCILTIAAAGSEMSAASVITNDELDTWQKKSYNSEISKCIFSILNPELTYTLPAYQSACGGVDIVMHTLERYFSPIGGMDITDGIAHAVIKTMLENMPKVLEDLTNYEAQSEIMWAGSISHNGITGCGGISDWSTHQLEHELSAKYDVAHGAGLSALWGSFARYVYLENPIRFKNIGINVFNINKELSDEAGALMTIEKMEEYFTSIKMPISIKELGLNLNEEDLIELADNCSINRSRTIGSFKPLNRDDMLEIYKMANKK